MSPSAPRRGIPVPAFLALFSGAAAGAALAWTNPNEQDYQAHAAEQLVVYATRELCENKGLPMLLRLWIRDCPDMVASQKQTLADLAGRFTTRWNFGVGSVYITRIGGQELLPGLQLPSAEVVTLAGAGQFVLLRTQTTSGGAE